MPDWAYHPFFRPLLFRLPGETARRVTIELLAFQARLPGGPALFGALAHSRVPAQLRTRFVGVDFPSPVGLAAGIDVEGRAAVLMQKLGFGFLELGPLGGEATRASRSTGPERVHDVHGLALHPDRGAPAAADAIRRLPPLDVPIGLELRGGDGAVGALACAAPRVAFVTLPAEAGESPARLRELRATSDRPLLVKLPAAWDAERIDAAVAHACAAGVDGACVVASAPIDPRLEREVISSAALAHALEVTARVGERLPVALSGGVLTPEDATAATEAGAGLIALSNGFVFAGPGLPQRINRRLDVGRTLPLDGADDANGDGDGHALGAVGAAPPASEPAPRAAATTTAERAGGLLLTVAAAAMLLIGAGYLVLAFTAKLLPNDTAHLGFGVAQLCTLDSCRIVHFISHDAAVYAGITLANGTLLTWIGRGPLRRREPWAWWAIALALIPLLLGFLSFLAYGYFNTVHAGMVAVVLVLLAAGLVLTRGVASGWRPHEALRAAAVRAWIWSPAGRGRYLLLGLALSTLLGGLAIVAIASTRVFVPEDLEYLRLSAHQVHAISPRLVPVMAHDRAEFGGGLMMFGVLLAASAWNGLRPHGRGVLIAIGVAGACHFVAAFTAHMLIGYTNPVHLFPVYWGATVLALAIVLLRRPVTRPVERMPGFPDV